MKLTILTTLLSGTLVSIALLSNSSGPANMGNGNKTGGPGSQGNCTGCHSGSSGTTASITVKRKSNNADVNGKYVPGETYLVTLTGNHSSLSKYGFQIAAQKTGNAQAGTWQALGSDLHTKTEAGLVLVEHHHTLSKSGSAFTNTLEWVAPVKGTGSVGIHGIINAVNDDNNTSGDAVSPTASLTLSEDPVSVADIDADSKISVYPNPVTNTLYLGTTKNISGISEVSIISLTGKKVFEGKVQTSAEPLAIPVSQLVEGIYQIIIMNNEVKHSSVFVKQ